MSIFDPVATYTTSTAQDELTAALNEPYVAKDMLDDPNLRFFTDAWMHGVAGTAIRDLSLPPLNPIAANRYERPEDFAARRAAAEAANPSLTLEQYKASPSYREQVPWEQGMTEDRAAAKAAQFDQSFLTQQLAEKKPIESFFMGLASGFADPTNFIVPYLGSGMGAAAAARFGWGAFGRIAAEAGVAAANNAVAAGVFGALTAGTRQKLGEDVSFNAILNEIAMSALIGGAFGTGIHLIGDLRVRAIERPLMAKAQTALETIETTSKSRAVAEIAADMLARRGDVELPPAAIETIRGIKDRVETVTAPERDAAVATVAAKAPDQPGFEVVTPSGLTIRAVPQIVDLRTLNQASGDLQVRDRSRFSSEAWVEGTAGKLDPMKLLPDRNAGLGAPVVGMDSTINSGNGRVKLILRAAEAHQEAYGNYLSTLREKGYEVPEAKNGEVYGLVMRQTSEMTPEGQAAWNTDANAPLVARMSSAEIAMMDARAMTDETLATLRPGELTSAANAEFRRSFINNLPELERGVMLTEDGNLSKDGARRIENAIVAAAYGKADPAVVRRFAETEDENARAVIGAMSDVAPKWSSFVREIERGDLKPEADMSPNLTQALSLISRWREQAKEQRRPVSAVIRERMNQSDMFAGDIRPEVKMFITMFYRDGHFATAMGRESLANNLSRLVDELRSSAAPSLFVDPTALTTPLEVLTHVTDTRLGDVSPDASLFENAQGNRNAPGDGQGDRSGPQPNGQADRQAAAATSVETVAGPIDLPAPGRPVALSDVPEGARQAVGKAFWQSAQERSIDELFAPDGPVAKDQAELIAFDKSLRQKYGIPEPVDKKTGEVKYAGAKKRVTAEQKMIRKGYKSASQMTDLVRTGFAVDTPEMADVLVKEFGDKYAVLDEGWNINDANYFDRKILVKFPDGLIAEVQFWHPDMLEAKEGSGGGHKLYEEARDLESKDPNDPRVQELYGKMQKLYRDALAEASPAWRGMIEDVIIDSKLGGGGRSGKALANASGDMVRPESTISSQETRSQPAPSDSTAAPTRLPPESMITAGRDSQSKNLVSMAQDIGTLPAVVDPIAPPKEPVPAEIQDAVKRLGKAETPAEIAELVGIDPKTGDFPEMKDIEQIKFEGRLTEEDQATLDQAKANYDNAVAYGKALEAAVSCVK